MPNATHVPAPALPAIHQEMLIAILAAASSAILLVFLYCCFSKKREVQAKKTESSPLILNYVYWSKKNNEDCSVRTFEPNTINDSITVP